MTKSKLGDGAAKIVTAMYILLNGKVPKTENSNGASVAAKKPGALKQAKVKTAESIIAPSTPKAVAPSADTQQTSGYTKHSPSIHIDLQIHISPEASSEQIDSIFASIAKHLTLNK